MYLFLLDFQESPFTSTGYSPSVMHRVAPASPRYSSQQSLTIDSNSSDPDLFASVDASAQSIGVQMSKQGVFLNPFRVYFSNSTSVAGSFLLGPTPSASGSNQYLIKTTENTPIVTIERNVNWYSLFTSQAGAKS
jgi:hypothetical protein